MKWFKIYLQYVNGSEDFIRTVHVAGKKLCIIKLEGEYFAVQSKCPHAGADLSNGWCTNGNLICPYHRHEFDLKTGRGAEGQGNYINTYPVELREDGLFIGIESPCWKFW